MKWPLGRGRLRGRGSPCASAGEGSQPGKPKRVLFPGAPEACAVAGGVTGQGLWLSPERGPVPALASGLGQPSGVGAEHRMRHTLTFHVRGHRQKQIFHRLMKSFKLAKFLYLARGQTERMRVTSDGLRLPQSPPGCPPPNVGRCGGCAACMCLGLGARGACGCARARVCGGAGAVLSRAKRPPDLAFLF